MTHRRIRDTTGRWWDVWEVYPSAVERRMSGEQPAVLLEGEVERRTKREVRVVVPSELQQGWLAFQTGEERRRLAPIPDGWITLPEGKLLELLTRAGRAGEWQRKA
jgi:hypothetical protein